MPSPKKKPLGMALEIAIGKASPGSDEGKKEFEDRPTDNDAEMDDEDSDSEWSDGDWENLGQELVDAKDGKSAGEVLKSLMEYCRSTMK